MVEGAVANYDALIDAFAARKAEIGISDESLDELIGWAAGYTGKLMGVTPAKRLGVQTMFECAQALGIELVLREIPGAAEKIQQRCGKRDERRVVTANVRFRRIPWLFKSENAREIAIKRHSTMDAKERSEHARRMSAARWNGHVSKSEKKARRRRARKAAMARWKRRRQERKARAAAAANRIADTSPKVSPAFSVRAALPQCAGTGAAKGRARRRSSCPRG